MQRIKDFEVHFTNDDVADIRILRQGRAPFGFVVNYRAAIRGKWRVVARWDTCHGSLHVHRFWRPREAEIGDVAAQIRWLPPWDQLVHIIEELTERWPALRRLAEEVVE